MNSTTYNNINHLLYTHYPTLIPVISGKQVHFKTKEEHMVKNYNELVTAIIKVIEIQYITHCTNTEYQLIMIHRAGDILIHIVLSKTLQKHLLKQKDKLNSVKTGVIYVKQVITLINGVMQYKTANLINK